MSMLYASNPTLRAKHEQSTLMYSFGDSLSGRYITGADNSTLKSVLNLRIRKIYESYDKGPR